MTLYYQNDNIVEMTPCINNIAQEEKTWIANSGLIKDITLAAAAVVHILRHPHYRFGNKAVWLVIATILLLFGPIIYFAFGKGEKE